MRLERWINELRQGAALVESLMAALEIMIIAAVGRLATWMAPLPSAILVGRAAGQIFSLAGYWPWIMAGVIELVGLACSSLWLTAREWNANKRKSDPAANERLALGLLVFYFLVTFSMLVVTELPKVWDLIPAEAAGLTSLLFPGLSAVALVALNERAAQSKRQAALDAEIAEREQRRTRQRVSSVHKAGAQNVHISDAQESSQLLQDGDSSSAYIGAQNVVLGAINRTRQTTKSVRMRALLDAYKDNPDLGTTDAAQMLGVHRNTVYGYLNELEETGRIHRNGDGVEVVA